LSETDNSVKRMTLFITVTMSGYSGFTVLYN